MAKTTFDVVVQLLERGLDDARNAFKMGKDNNAPNLKELEKAVEEAQGQLDKYRESRGGDRGRLTEKYLGDYYDEVGDWVRDLVDQFPDLTNLFSKAVSENWSADKFTTEIYKSDWWASQKEKGRGSRWLETFILENDPAKQGQWVDAIDEVKLKILDIADSVYNMSVDEAELDKIARRYLYQGWDKADERGLRVWLARQFGKPQADGSVRQPGGMVLDVERTLADAVRDYGLSRPEGWAASTAAKILDPLAKYSEDDAWNDLIAEAESKYPVFAGRLSKDRSLRDVAAGYISELAQMLEINDPNSVDLSDPLLKRAFTSLDEKNQPRLMPLWEFNQQVKKDERWQYTNNALNTYSSIGSDLARMMGFVG